MKKVHGFRGAQIRRAMAVLLVLSIGVVGIWDGSMLTAQASETETVQTAENAPETEQISSTEQIPSTEEMSATEAVPSTEELQMPETEKKTEAVSETEAKDTAEALGVEVSSENETEASSEVETETPETEIQLTQPVISAWKNSAAGKLEVTVTGVADAAGYEYSFCADSKFVSHVKKVTTAKTTYTLSGLAAGNVYVKVRAYAKKASGELRYSTESSVKKLKITSSYKGKTTKLASLKNSKAGTVAGKITAVEGAVKYVVQYAADKKFKNKTALTTTSTAFTVKYLAKRTYYFRTLTYWQDPVGHTIKAASYGKVKSIKVTKAVTEYSAKSNRAVIKSCKVLSASKASVKATVNKRVKSSDDYYYLVSVNPSTGKVVRVGKTLKEASKGDAVSFEVPISGKKKNNLELKYAIAVLSGSSYRLISKQSYLANPEKAAVNTDAIQTPKTKKGIQGYEYAVYGDGTVNPKHVFFNVDLATLISKKGAAGAVAYSYGGKTYYFSNAGLPTLYWICKDNIQVTMQVNLSWKSELSYLTYGQQTNISPFYALNPSNEKAYRTLEAAFSFLGEYYSGKNGQGYVTNWVLGNEVNAKTQQNYAPSSVSYEDYVKNYAVAFRLLYYGVKRGFGNARVYICLDHSWGYEDNILAGEHWTIYDAKTFMTDFNVALKRESSAIKWNLAFHPYAFPLSASDFWNQSSVNASNGVEHITMKNLETMTDFVKDQFGSNTSILLSEVGYSSGGGQDKQAAAIAYTYYKAEFNPMIDAVIFRSYMDNEGELSMGLAMGLTTENAAAKKEAYNVFKYMDTKKSTTYTNPYLKTIGVSNWASIIPGYQSSKFKKF